MTGRPQTPPPKQAREDFVRLPGLFRRWELEQLLEPDAEFRIEMAGEAQDGCPLLAVYRREVRIH